tara:strand:- start:373 stop:1269 length:897 start_codon:yes stop_codon:yes gene_type:complete
VPQNKLSEAEEQQIIAVSNEEDYVSLPPSQIIPKLADKGIYLASESSFYRVMKKHNQLAHRGKQRKSCKKAAPTTYVARKPNEVWTWDITYLAGSVKGKYFYLYLVTDIFSRYGVAWEVCESESGKEAAELMTRAKLNQNCLHQPLVLHSDNGAPMKSLTLKAKLEELNVIASYSRPRVSNDNPYSEAMFKTLKYCPQWPSKGFSDIEAARGWVNEFMDWYNNKHCHSGIKFVTPAQRHEGKDHTILDNRTNVYEVAFMRHPERWSGERRNWSRPTEVTLNPEKIEHLAEAVQLIKDG